MLSFKTLVVFHDACFTDFIMKNPMKKPPVAISNPSRGNFFFARLPENILNNSTIPPPLGKLRVVKKIVCSL
jgi:hypothetical protein